MDEFTKNLGKKLLTLLWYLSNYADYSDYTETTRSDMFDDIIEDLYPYCEEYEDNIRQIIKEFKKSYKGHPYEKRVNIFSDDFFKSLVANEDSRELFIKGDKIRGK